MCRIYIITFKRGNLEWSRFEHWGILVVYKNGDQYLYHADKDNDDNTTFYQGKDLSKFNNELINLVHYKILVGYTTKLTHKEMEQICTKISENREFHLIF